MVAYTKAVPSSQGHAQASALLNEPDFLVLNDDSTKQESIQCTSFI